MTPQRASAPKVTAPSQHLSWSNRFVAGFLNRRKSLLNALIAAGVVAITLGVNVAYLVTHGRSGPWYQVFFNALTFLSQGYLNSPSQDTLGSALIVFNLLFTVIFAQTILDTVRGLLSRLPLQERQAGLAATFGDHVIVCGMGRVGYRVATRLVAAGERVLVIERNWGAKFVAQIVAQRVPVIIGDARDDEVLLRAGIRRARAIMAIIDGDLINLEIILAARRLNPTIRVIARAFNDDFDAGIESAFGEHTAFSVSALATPTFTAATITRDLAYLLTPGPSSRDVIGVMTLEIDAQRQTPEPLATLEQRANVRIIAQASQGKTLRLHIVGVLPNLESVRTFLCSASLGFLPSLQSTPDRDLVIVCGLGKIGYRLVTQLSGMALNIRIAVIQRREDEDSPFTKTVQSLPNVRIVYGDARDASVLVEAGLHRALTVAAVTSADEQNVRMALEARRLQPQVHIVLRVFSEDLADRLAALFKIFTTYSVSNLAGPSLVAAALIPGVQQAFVVENTFFLMLLWQVTGSANPGPLTVGALRQANKVTIVGVRQGTTYTLMPSDQTGLRPGDEVAVVAELSQMRAFLKHPTLAEAP